MVLGKAAEKASRTNFFLPSDENPGHKPKVLFVLRLNISLKRASAFGPYNHTLLLGSLEHFCLGLRAGDVLLWALQCLHHCRRSRHAGKAEPSRVLPLLLSAEREASQCVEQTRWCGLNPTGL